MDPKFHTTGLTLASKYAKIVLFLRSLKNYHKGVKMSVLSILTIVFVGIVALLSATGAFSVSNKILGREHKIPITVNLPTTPIIGLATLVLIGGVLYRLLQR